MPEIAPVSQSVSRGWTALSRGSWKEARAIFEQELEAGESAEALEGLSWAAWWLDEADTVFEAASAPTAFIAKAKIRQALHAWPPCSRPITSTSTALWLWRAVGCGGRAHAGAAGARA
jgi:hypothetical protein